MVDCFQKPFFSNCSIFVFYTMNIQMIDYSSSSDEDMIEFLNVSLSNSIPNIRNYRIRLDAFNHFSDVEFKNRFRFSKETVIVIADNIEGEEIINNRGKPVSKLDQILIALRFYATGSFLNIVGDIIKVHKSTVCRVIRSISHKLAALRPRFIKMPQGNELKQVKRDFFRIGSFPNVIGCVDCTHIKIQSPGGPDADLFKNGDGYFSINVQALCNSSLMFTDMTAQWQGSVDDSTIFDSSEIGLKFGMGEYPNSYLLADSDYPCRSYLLTPVLNPQTESEHRYNAAHKQTSNCIVRTFHTWKLRFPCLSLRMRTKVNTTQVIIIATAVLHNIAILEHDEIEDDASIAQDEGAEVIQPSAADDDQFDARNFLIENIFK